MIIDESFANHDMRGIMEPTFHDEHSDHQALANASSDPKQGLKASDKPVEATTLSVKNYEDESAQLSTPCDEPLARKEEASEPLTNHDMIAIMKSTTYLCIVEYDQQHAKEGKGTMMTRARAMS
ncbi:hypothetical protein FMUND_13590 [Fusarium mundagurra]|uniref:Uncharacterized protein n=1 Tax=Fusarium mundagurra TaxID=1567541 RepID=A0A8H5XY77_9HYPO|nr:hypothetical protein FMUND_13590 [Fusarium mundagurra]